MSGFLDYPFLDAFGLRAGKPVEPDMANQQSQPDYASSARDAIDALRRTAGGARVRQIGGG